jgi:hypothetical protein
VSAAAPSGVEYSNPGANYLMAGGAQPQDFEEGEYMDVSQRNFSKFGDNGDTYMTVGKTVERGNEEDYEL